MRCFSSKGTNMTYIRREEILGFICSKFSFYIVYDHAQLLSCVQFFATLWTTNPPDSCVHGITQARILEWIAISSSRGPL